MKILPKNKAFFIRLKKFCKEILDICKKNEVTPIAYGGLIYFAYTRNKNYAIKDIDFLIPENSFNRIMKDLKKKGIKYKYYPKWHTMPIFKGNLRIELDSTDFWQKNLPKDFRYFDFDGLVVKAVSLDTIIKIYKHASEVSKDKPEQHLKRFEALKKLKELK